MSQSSDYLGTGSMSALTNLGLPLFRYHAYGGGGLTIWDGEDDAEEFVYPVRKPVDGRHSP